MKGFSRRRVRGAEESERRDQLAAVSRKLRDLCAGSCGGGWRRSRPDPQGSSGMQSTALCLVLNVHIALARRLWQGRAIAFGRNCASMCRIPSRYDREPNELAGSRHRAVRAFLLSLVTASYTDSDEAWLATLARTAPPKGCLGKGCRQRLTRVVRQCSRSRMKSAHGASLRTNQHDAIIIPYYRGDALATNRSTILG